MEFGRALVSKILGGDPSLRYVGFLNDTQFQELGKFASDAVYKFWDQSDSSPPQQRPRDDSTGPVTPDLQILGYHNGSPFWPAMISERIQPDTPEHEALLKMKEKFEKMFPPTTASETSARTTPAPGRAGGQCDFTVDEGREPLDVNRMVELEAVKDEHFTEQRLSVSK